MSRQSYLRLACNEMVNKGMGNMEESRVDKHAFWNQRAWNGEYAGTNDLLIKRLELAELGKQISSGLRILEVGCGNGESAMHFASLFDVRIDAIDFSEGMISAANSVLEKSPELMDRVKFSVADIKTYSTDSRYDLIYSQRSLINLDTWQEQKDAIEKILGWLAPRGRFLMCENSSDGLAKINSYRVALGLPAIDPPWHNRYFVEKEIEQVCVPNCRLEVVDSFSSTYYFLSRIINAALAKQAGEEPKYESPINLMALQLPPINDCGQTKLWMWRRDATANSK